MTERQADGSDRRAAAAAPHLPPVPPLRQLRRGRHAPYVDALEARGIPHLLVGGKAFHDREEVETIRAALAAIEWPDDELSVFATLRGSLFAIDDEAAARMEERRDAAHAASISHPEAGSRARGGPDLSYQSQAQR